MQGEEGTRSSGLCHPRRQEVPWAWDPTIILALVLRRMDMATVIEHPVDMAAIEDHQVHMHQPEATKTDAHLLRTQDVNQRGVRTEAEVRFRRQTEIVCHQDLMNYRHDLTIYHQDLTSLHVVRHRQAEDLLPMFTYLAILLHSRTIDRQFATLVTGIGMATIEAGVAVEILIDRLLIEIRMRHRREHIVTPMLRVPADRLREVAIRTVIAGLMVAIDGHGVEAQIGMAGMAEMAGKERTLQGENAYRIENERCIGDDVLTCLS